MTITNERNIEALQRENKMLRDCLMEQTHKEAQAAQAAMDAKRAQAAQQTVIQEVALAGEELERSRMAAWWGFHLKKQITDGRGSEVFNFELIRPTIPPHVFPPGDRAENYTKTIAVSLAEAKLTPDFAKTTLGKMLAAHRAARKV